MGRAALLLVILVGYFFPAQAEDSATLVRKHPVQQYEIFRGVYAKLINEALERHTGPLPSNSASESGLLVFCGGGELEIYHEDKRTWEFAMLAFEIVQTSISLKLLKYPEAVWKEDLAEYETQQSHHIAKHRVRSDRIAYRYTLRLFTKLTTYQKVTDSTLKPVIGLSWQHGCGEYHMSVKVVTRPRGGRVQVLPYLYYAFCEAQGLNAKNFKECNHWDEVRDGEELRVSGTYYYRALWKGGRALEGRKNFDNARDGSRWLIAR